MLGEITAQLNTDMESLGAGGNVVGEDGSHGAEICGYACLIAGDLHVLSLIWTTPD